MTCYEGWLDGVARRGMSRNVHTVQKVLAVAEAGPLSDQGRHRQGPLNG